MSSVSSTYLDVLGVLISQYGARSRTQNVRRTCFRVSFFNCSVHAINTRSCAKSTGGMLFSLDSSSIRPVFHSVGTRPILSCNDLYSIIIDVVLEQARSFCEVALSVLLLKFSCISQTVDLQPLNLSKDKRSEVHVSSFVPVCVY